MAFARPLRPDAVNAAVGKRFVIPSNIYMEVFYYV